MNQSHQTIATPKSWPFWPGLRFLHPSTHRAYKLMATAFCTIGSLLLAQVANTETTGTLHGVKIATCVRGTCIQLRTPYAEHGMLDGVFSFSEAHLEIEQSPHPDHAAPLPAESLLGEDGYLDSTMNVLVVRGLKHSKWSELTIDLATGAIDRF